MKCPLVSIKGSSTNPRLPSLKAHLHLLLDYKSIAEAQVQDAQVSGMQESLVRRPASEAEPQESLLLREDTELFEVTFVEPFEQEAGPVHLPNIDQALSIPDAIQSPVDVAADVAAGVAAAVSAFQHIFLAAVVHIGAAESFSLCLR